MKSRVYLFSTFLLLNVSITLSQSHKEETAFVIVEQMPEFKSENAKRLKDYLADKIEYPLSAYNEKIEGTVYIQIVVDIDGSIKNLNISKKVLPSLDYEALRLVASTDKKWQAGKHRGIAIPVAVVIPVSFSLKKNILIGEQDRDKDYNKLISSLLSNYKNKKQSAFSELLRVFHQWTLEDGWYYYNDMAKYINKNIVKISIDNEKESTYLIFPNPIFSNENKNLTGNLKKEFQELIKLSENEYFHVVSAKTSGKKMYLSCQKAKSNTVVSLNYQQIETKEELTAILQKLKKN